jgi:siroheme synthase
LTPGTVHLVGAGPGDPELITVRGLRLLRTADVVVHDRLVHPDLVTEARPDAEIVDVGKAPGRTSPSQEAIGRLLVGLCLLAIRLAPSFEPDTSRGAQP